MKAKKILPMTKKRRTRKFKLSLGEPAVIKKSQTADNSLAGHRTEYHVEYDVTKLAANPKALVNLIKKRLSESPHDIAYVILKFRMKVRNKKTGDIYEKDAWRTLPRSKIDMYLKGRWDGKLISLLGR